MCLNEKWLVELEDWGKPWGWAESASKGRHATWTVVKVSRVWLSSLACPGDKALVLEAITGVRRGFSLLALKEKVTGYCQKEI